VDLDAKATVRQRLDAVKVFYGMEFFDTLGMQAAFTVWAVYLVQDVGVNPLQLVLLGTVSEIAIFLFEVPTGVVADTYSRRLSIIVGMIMAGASLVLFGLVPVYWVIVVAAIIRGIAGTFMSGAWEAWITDEHGVDGIGRVFLRGTQFSYLGAIVGSGLGVAIATQDLGAGIAFGGVVSVATGIACIFVMPEHGFVRRPVEERTSPLRAMTTTAATGVRLVRGHNILLLIVGITFFAGAASEGLDRLWEAHLIRDVGLPELFGLDPVVWFGVFNIAGLVAGIVITSFLVPRFEHADNSKLARTLLGLTIVLSVSVVIFGLAASFAVAAIAYLVARLARRLKDPLYSTWLNKNVEDSSVRATVNSIASQADAMGEVAGGPAIGVVGTVASLRAALVATGLLLTPTIALFLRAIRHGGREPELEEAEAPA
jgi:MFS family permease